MMGNVNNSFGLRLSGAEVKPQKIECDVMNVWRLLFFCFFFPETFDCAQQGGSFVEVDHLLYTHRDDVDVIVI